MYRAISRALLVAGALLLIFGVSASQSVGSDVSRYVSGSPTDKAIWMLIGGAALCVIGLVGLLRGHKVTS